MKLILGFILFGIATNCLAPDTPCGDWTAYKDEKCFKVLDKAGTQSFEDAEKLCKTEDSASHLISITFQEEQTFLTDFLFNKHKVVDNVWIGAKLSAAKKFVWENGAELSFTNWAPGRPKNLDGYCVQMEADVGSLGKWVDEPCKRKNAVVCQKKQTLSIARIQEILFEVKQNPVPIGFIYVQLPKEKAPQEIWLWMTWTDVSSVYDGVFFRVAGKDAAAFGSVQEDNAPRLTEVETGSRDIDLHLKETDYNWMHIDVPRSGKSKWVHIGHRQGEPRMGRFTSSGGEVRPRNMAMRVWKRTG